jgi:DNA-binding winged helix-turn-helix (wHTH) protein
MSSNGRSRLRFGQLELDLTEEKLLKKGLPLRLENLPLQLLAALLESPGEVVSREELCARLWPDGTYVDFDEGLNTAIKKLRYALGDSAENPTFIETVPRRGYRFIAPVQSDVGFLVQSLGSEHANPQTVPARDPSESRIIIPHSANLPSEMDLGSADRCRIYGCRRVLVALPHSISPDAPRNQDFAFDLFWTLGWVGRTRLRWITAVFLGARRGPLERSADFVGRWGKCPFWFAVMEHKDSCSLS